MTKVIRKYNKILLAIFGVFLLITWLFTGSSNIFQPKPEKQVMFTLGSTKVLAGEFSHSTTELEALKLLIPDLVARLGVQDATHWFLLTREAKAQGLVGNAKDGEEWLPELATSLVPIRLEYSILNQYRTTQPAMYRFLLENRNFLSQLVQQELRDPQQIKQVTETIEQQLREGRPSVAGRSRLTEEELDLALAKLRGVVRMFNGYAHAGRLSDKRLAEAARNRFDRVKASVVSVPAMVMVDTGAAPADAELQAHFDKYKAVEKGDGEFGFGYAQPERVKMDWIKVDIGAVQSAVVIDPVAANIHWQKNRAKFPGDFGAEKDKVVSELKTERVKDVFAEADRAYKAKLRSETRRLETDGPVKRLPADWQPPTMEALAQAIVDGVQNTLKVTLPAPTVEHRSDWVRIPEAAQLSGIGQSSMMVGTREVSLSELLINTLELKPRLELGLQSRVPYEAGLTDNLGNRYYILVSQCKAAGPADEIADVRAEVIRDVQSLAAFQALEARLPALEAQAAAEGLDAVSKVLSDEAKDKSRALTPFHDQQFTQSRSPEIVNDSPDGVCRKAIIGQARVLGVLTPPTAENMPLRTVAVPIPKTRTVVIGQVTGVDPVTAEIMHTIRPGMSDTIISDELQEAGGAMPYTLDTLKTRMLYKDAREKSEDHASEGAPKA
ncbi:MAG: hypothetical protein U0637_08025 [Phycisphaerales bacterium]